MNGVNNSVAVYYTSADVGILTPPDKIKGYKCATDAELETKFQTLHKDVYSKQKHISFEDKKKTPTLVKILFGGGLIALLWQLIKAVRK